MCAALLGLVSCSKEDKNSEDATTETVEAVETETPAEEATEVTEAAEEVEGEEVAEEATEAEESADAANIDEMLAGFEKAVANVTETAKLVKKKDLAAISKLPQLIADAKEMQSNLEQFKSQMNDNQKATFQAIIAKLVEATAK